MRPLISYAFVVVSSIACTTMCQKAHRNMEAYEVVEAYLNMAFNIEKAEDILDLASYTTGALKASLVNASLETIREAYISKNYQLHAYQLDKEHFLTPREARLSFTLSYEETPKDKLKANPRITKQTKILMVREDGLWLIANVEGGSTEFEFPLGFERP